MSAGRTNPWAMSADSPTMGRKDTTQESTPERRCSAKSSGASPTTKGHDRLVTSIDARSDAPESPCPICGRPGSGNAHDNGWGVATATYIDDAGHLWSTRWLTISDEITDLYTSGGAA